MTSTTPNSQGSSMVRAPAPSQQDWHEPEAGRKGQIARREGPVSLSGMVAIGREVQQVVEHIGARGRHAEGQESDRAVEDERQFLNPMRQQQRDEDQHVLHPLVQPKGFQVGWTNASSLAERPVRR